MSVLSARDASHADVIVVGAGILGTFHAYFASKKGYKTLLLECNPFPNDASTRNFGMIVQTIVAPGGEWAMYAHSSRETYLELQLEYGLAVRQIGSMYVASTETEASVLQEFAYLYATTYYCEYLDAGEALRRYPFLSAAYCKAVLRFPDDLALEPRLLLRQLISHVTQSGLIGYAGQTAVVSVEVSGQHCVVKDAHGNTYISDRVFICNGAKYQVLCPHLFHHSSLKICKLQMMQTVPQPAGTLPHSVLSGLSILRYPGFSACPSYALLRQQSVEEHLRDYGIHLLFKQAIDGSVIIGDSHAYSSFEDADKGEEYTDWRINEAILEYGKRMLSLPSWEIQQFWNGYYIVHPQQEIYTETIEGRIHVVTGIGGKGMSTGPGFARSHVEAVLG
jgi:D-hydroxyproline dehydrogenase subunit beta